MPKTPAPVALVKLDADTQRWVRVQGLVALTQSDEQLLRAISAGLSNEAIAALTQRTKRTVEGQLTRLVCRLNVANRRSLAIVAEDLYGSPPVIPQLDLSALTDRQLEVLDLATQGLSYQQIGEQLNIKAESVWARMDAIKQLVHVDSLDVLLAAARKTLAQR